MASIFCDWRSCSSIADFSCSARRRSVMSRKTTVNSCASPTLPCEIEASRGNSWPSARTPTTGRPAIMGFARALPTCKTLHVPAVIGAKPVGNEPLQWQAQGLTLRQTEHRLGRRVKNDDFLRGIHRDDGVQRHVNNASQTHFAFQQLFLSLPAILDHQSTGHQMAHLTRFVQNGLQREVDPGENFLVFPADLHVEPARCALRSKLHRLLASAVSSLRNA